MPPNNGLKEQYQFHLFALQNKYNENQLLRNHVNIITNRANITSDYLGFFAFIKWVTEDV